MKRIKFMQFSIALLSMVFFLSCEKSCPIESNSNLSSFNEIKAMESFSTALSMAVHENQEIRDLIKKEALGRFDNDYDVLYQNIKSAQVSESMSFRDVLVSYMEDPEEMEIIERLVPELTIYVSDVTWLDPQGFCAENWDTTDDCVAVTYKRADGFCEKLFAGGCLVDEIDSGTIPGGPVLIVKKNERIVASGSTKAGDFQYGFIDDAFNGKHRTSTRINRHSGKYSTSWLAGQTPEDNSDIISATALNNLNPDIITAYNLFNGHPYAVHNDYVYYGLTSSSDGGALRSDVRSKIVRFKMSPRSFNAIFDDAYGHDKDFVDSFETDDNGKGYNAAPSLSKICAKLWGDGALEIRVRVAALGSDGSMGVVEDYFYDVKASDLFTVKSGAIKKEQWGSTVVKWYITWKYSITSRDQNTLVEKWYYPENAPDLPSWDLFSTSAYTVVVSEEDCSGTTSQTITCTSKRANQSSSKISKDASLSLGSKDSNNKLSGTYKKELGWSCSEEETVSSSSTVTLTLGSDPIVTALVSFGDKYIKNKVSSSSYNIYSYSSDRFSFTILPYRY